MIGLIIVVVLAVIGIDAIWVRCRLRLRTRATRRARRGDIGSRGPEGWSRVDSVAQIFSLDDEVGTIDDDSSGSRFDSIVGSNGRRRGPGR